VNLRHDLRLRGHVRIYGHKPGYSYARDTYRRGRVLHDRRNSIQAAGLAYIAQMLLADPVNDPQKWGITQIGVNNDASPPVEVHKADLTDQFTSGASVVNVLYLTSVQPASQPVNLTGATLYLDNGGLTKLATATFATIAKTTLLAVTFEWSIDLS
jgi:hypothetical protein